MKKLLVLSICFACLPALSQMIQWRLVGASSNFERGTTFCSYEGRTSDGTTVTASRIVRGYVCPMTPQGS